MGETHGLRRDDLDHPYGSAALDEGTWRAGKSVNTSRLMRARDGNGVSDGAEAAVDRASSSSGDPLPAAIQSRFETCLDTPLGGVRVHTGEESASAAASVGARAYAVGNDIHFAAGQYRPDDQQGLHLLAHEVAHTVQQSGAAPHRQHKLEVSAAGDAHEVEADLAADAMIAGARAVISGAAGGLARKAQTGGALDDAMTTAGNAAAATEGKDNEVQMMNRHSTVADQAEAKKAIAEIKAAQDDKEGSTNKVYELSKVNDKFDYLKDNATALVGLNQYLATVTDAGDWHGQFAAAFKQAKTDHGEFNGVWNAFSATHALTKNGNRDAADSLTRKDPAFAQAFGEFKQTRNDIATDVEAIKQHRDDAQVAKDALSAKLHLVKSRAAGSKAEKKKTELAALMASIDEAAGTIMTVGKMAMAATTGFIAMGDGAGGMDMSKLVATPGIEAPPAPAPAPAPAVKPSSGAREIDPSALGPATPAPATPAAPAATPEGGYSMPTNTMASLNDIASKGISLAGGPDKLIKQAITELEKANIDGLKAQIKAAQQEKELEEAAAAADELKAAKGAYASAINKVASLVASLMKHKAKLNEQMDHLKSLAAKNGSKDDLVPALRLVTVGDRFIAQAELAISIGQSEQAECKSGREQRGKMSDDHMIVGKEKGATRIHYWTAEKRDNGAMLFSRKVWTAIRHDLEFTAMGSDQAQDASAGGIKKLMDWKTEVEQKRNQAQASLGIGDAVASTKNG